MHFLRNKLTKEKILQKPGFGVYNEISRPAFRIVRVLRSGKSVDVGAMFRNEHEVTQIPSDELGFVLCPNWINPGLLYRNRPQLIC